MVNALTVVFKTSRFQSAPVEMFLYNGVALQESIETFIFILTSSFILMHECTFYP